MTIKRLVEQHVWNEVTQQWEQGYTPTAAQIVETSDGSNVQAKLDAIPGQIITAKDTAIAEIRADVPENGNTLAKLHALVLGIQELVKSDDVNLDTVQEIADYIKANRTDLTLIGTNKVGYEDIINNLTIASTVEGKTLDARQGKVLKDLIDVLTGNVSALQSAAANYVTSQQLTDGMTAATASARTVISATPPANPVDGQVWLKPAGSITI